MGERLVKSLFRRFFSFNKANKNHQQAPCAKTLAQIKYPDTNLPLNKLGKLYPPYQHTFNFCSKFINEHHKFYSVCPVDAENKVSIKLEIPGWLRRDDALKLYELAYFCNGDVMELGTYQGLSTSIMAKAFDDTKKNIKFLQLILFLNFLKKLKKIFHLQLEQRE